MGMSASGQMWGPVKTCWGADSHRQETELGGLSWRHRANWYLLRFSKYYLFESFPCVISFSPLRLIFLLSFHR